MKLFFKKKLAIPLDFSFFPDILNRPRKFIKIIKKSQKSPLFVTDTSIIKNRLKHFPKSIKIAYSFKTNYDVAKKISFSMAEVVSETELIMALKQKYPYSSLVFNGPNKGNLHNLLSKPLIINIDNFTELKSLLSYKKTIKSKIGLRINFKFNPSHFGFNLESGDAKKAIDLLQENKIPISGLHIHIGSDIQSPEIYQKCSVAINKFVSKNIFQNTLEYIDFGGGYPSHGIIPGTKIQSLPKINKYLKSIIKPIQPILNKGTILILEPGRYLVDDSTILISKVVSSKITKNHQTIIIDSTINMLPSAWYHQLITKGYDNKLILKNNPQSNIETKIFGCSCQESDFLYQGKFPSLIPNDYVIFFCVGAYNQSQATQFIYKTPPTFFTK